MDNHQIGNRSYTGGKAGFDDVHLFENPLEAVRFD